MKAQSEYNLDKVLYLNNGWSEQELNDAIELLNSEKRTSRTVSYYCKSYHKLNKKFPVSKDFNIEQFQFSEKEKEQIMKSMKEK